MIACPRCAAENPEGSRFCNNCGASLVARVGVQERRVVSALFADLARSTTLGERLDPEIVRGLVGDFFELARTEIERRGGTVEKFSGDAVMAVFGLPQAHEDDPERAVRSALAIQRGLAPIADEARTRHGIEVQARIGIESGEVVVGDPFGGATMATGDAMNLAARLEQQAHPGDVVLGEAAYASVRDMVAADTLGSLELRGHEAALAGWRVTGVAEEVGRPRGIPGLQAPLTGRDEELNLLLDAGRRAVHERKAIMFSVLGTPGVGKSRLVREAVARMEADGATAVRGRCLPYGEGITYWPAAEIVRELADIASDAGPEETRARLTELAPDDEVARRLEQILGVAQTDTEAVSGGDRELAWSMRRLVEHLATTRGPLVLVVEDIHWGEPPLLDLLEYLATWIRDAPVFIACTSRPELLDNRAGWGAGRMEASRIMLEPLDEEESRALLGALLTVDDLPASLRQQVLDRAEGNPLFVEEVVRMLIEEGLVERRGERWLARREAADVRVPDSVEALIRARLDTLPAQERGVLQAASVVGRVFQQSAVVAIAPRQGGDGQASVQRDLEEAVLRDLIVEESAPDEPTYRFRHILIRDVAYSTLPKARRAQLHHAVADWLRAWAGERIDEFVEILAYHLEQSVRLRLELGTDVAAAERDDAIATLETSARHALTRDDARATRGFAERALALEPPPGTQRMELAALLADAHGRLNNFREAAEIGTRLEQEAAAAGRKDLQGRAIFARAEDIWRSLGRADLDAGMTELRRAREVLSDAHDDRHLLDVLELMGFGGWWRGRLVDSEEAWSEMRRVAHVNGWLSREAEALSLVARLYYYRNDVPTATQLLLESNELAKQGTSRLSRARVERRLGGLVEASGLPGVDNSSAEAERLLSSAAVVLEEFGDREELNIALVNLGDIKMTQGRPQEALAMFEQGLENVMEHGGFRAETQRRVAEALVALGDIDRAASVAEEAVTLVAEGDVFTVASTSGALATVREAQGDFAEAERLLRHAIELLGETDFINFEWTVQLAELLYRQGRPDEAEPMAERARSEARRQGPHSPTIPYVEQRLTAAREAAKTD